jgi:mono/diheme cytochrome c family protein
MPRLRFALVALAPLAAAAGTPAPPPTFGRDVAPILHRRCAPCHRPGQVAPFPLLDYRDAARRAEQIAEVTARRIMPPWKPEPGYGRFRDERVLSAEEIDLLRRWAEAGAPEGDPAAAPPPPAFAAGWQLGEPDLVATMAEPFVVPAEGHDVFRNFVFPVGLDADRFVEAIELRPDNPRVVHHATILLDPLRRGREFDAQDAAPGFSEGMLWTGGFALPEGHFLAWTPGRIPRLQDDSWVLPAGGDLVLEAHLLPTGEPEPLRAAIGLHFTDRPPARRTVTVRLGTESIDIPAGEPDYRLGDRFVLPVDVELLSIYPHAHYLGREIRAWAARPGGAREELLWIRDWDFHWQDQYEYEPPVALPAGTAIEVEFAWDNSAANPANPSAPPRRVRLGPRSSDEMGNVWLQAVARDEAERARLAAAVEDHYAGVVIDGLGVRLAETPGDAVLHAELADHLARAGRLEEAAEHYRRAAALRPDSVAIQNNLAAVLTRLGRWEDAVVHYRAAARLDPGLAAVRINLGAALIAAGRLDEAVAELRAALRLAPGHPEARRLLAEAVARLERSER